MRILLLAMPDTVSLIDYYSRMPNLALVSLAGNLAGHDVKVFDLVTVKPRVRRHLEKLLRDFRPEVVGVSAMTFQYDSLLRVARFIRGVDPAIRIVAGGYHPSLMADEMDADLLDFVVRGEGEITLRELVDGLQNPRADFGSIRGLSFKSEDGRWTHNEDRPLTSLNGLPLPRRDGRVTDGYHILGNKLDVAETSRGCPYLCRFCSITRMYGSQFRTFPIARIVTDLEAVKARGTRAVFFADDNITHDPDHFAKVCRAIIDHRLNSMWYTTQMTAVGIARNPELVRDMKRARFRLVFVGFETMDPAALRDLKKPTTPDLNAKAAELLRKHGIAVIAGCIFGYPDDTRESIVAGFKLIMRLKPDLIYAQYLTPYPKTPLRDELISAGLVANEKDFSAYDGFTCNVRTRHLSCQELSRLLQRQLLLYNIDPQLILANQILRVQPLSLIRAAGKAALSHLRRLRMGGDRQKSLDL
ncbi:MAG: radical SAM protein [Acidobacteriota bacterium]